MAAEGDEQVALAGAGGADETQVLSCGDPLEAGQVVEGRGLHRRRSHVELVEGLGDRERCRLEAGGGVGCITRRDLGLDQGAQELFWCPTLSLGGDQQLGGQSAHGAEAEPA
jgi:hypothetical protein